MTGRLPQTMRSFLDEHIKRLYYFRDRWEDEKEYEDFASYRKAVVELFADAGFSTVTVSKRFAVRCSDDDGIRYDIRVNLRGLTAAVESPGPA